MPKKRLKIILSVLGLMISPMILAALASVVFLAVHLARGESVSAGMLALTSLVNDLLPYLPYITGIPAVLVILALIVRNKRR